jgi:predicted Fe-Mo cluster-binding NifX family protein
MSKIGVMKSADRADEHMSSHFGKAEWIMLVNPDNSTLEFVRNEGLNGMSAVEIAIREGLTDVIFTEIGNGAFGHLRTAGIRGWVAPEHTSGQQALRMFTQSQLEAASSPTKPGEGHGCCCASRTGSETATCCRG